MVSRVYVLLLGLLSATLPYLASAQAVSAVAASAPEAPAQQMSAKTDPRVAIASRIPGTRPEEFRASPIPGIYELTRGSEIAYVTTDGKYGISGDLYDLAANDNLTEQRRRDTRTKAIGAIPESEMLVFGPKDPKYTITVFTDVDCAYCRQLHSEMAEYNRLGIRVRYLFYPRSGPNTESWTKAEEVWCSDNRNEALTRAKLGQNLNAKPCANNPVARDYALGRDFGLQGTPAIILASGEMLPGYVPPAMLAQQLRKGQKQ